MEGIAHQKREYVGVKYLPADLTLMDPSHIRADDVIRLLTIGMPGKPK